MVPRFLPPDLDQFLPEATRRVINAHTDTCLADSWTVLEDYQLAVDDDTKQRFDSCLGPDVRQVQSELLLCL